MQLTYMPTVHDPDETVVDGVAFKAYEPTEVDELKKADLVAKLRRNPWFTHGEPDADRKMAWERARAAQAQAKKHREEAARMERAAETGDVPLYPM